MIIAIDGPAASGKGTLARRLASHYGLRHLDTGLLYRAVANKLLAAGHRLDDRARAAEAATSLDPADLADPALKGHAIGEASSALLARAIGEMRLGEVEIEPGYDGKYGTISVRQPDSR